MTRDDPTLRWTNVYGLARTLLAASTLLTLACNSANLLFRPLGVEIARGVHDIPLLRFSLFTLLPGDRLEIARGLAIAILALVVIGWRPRITGLLHWWVTASFAVSSVIVEGGDQAAAILTLLLVPVTLTDGRRSHWSAPEPADTGPRPALSAIASAVASSALAFVRLQMAVIYFFACTAKLGVAEWANGTALYYWFLHPIFGVDGWRRSVLLPILVDPVGVTLMTWGAMTIEALLFMGLLMEKRFRPRLLWTGILFHAGIAAIHGLPTFGMVMIAGLVLYLVPTDRALTVGAPVFKLNRIETLAARG
jgi:antimicrobial peptide system SdpB family protein